MEFKQLSLWSRQKTKITAIEISFELQGNQSERSLRTLSACLSARHPALHPTAAIVSRANW